MTDAYQLLAHSDAGFRREEKDEVFIGRATRGANFLRAGKATDGSTVVHLLEWISCQMKQVTRSTFTSKAGAVLLSADALMVLNLTVRINIWTSDTVCSSRSHGQWRICS